MNDLSRLGITDSPAYARAMFLWTTFSFIVISIIIYAHNECYVNRKMLASDDN